LLGALVAGGGRRFISKPERLDQSRDFVLLWGGLLLITVSGFLVEGLRILGTGFPAFEVWSPVGYSLAGLFKAAGLGGSVLLSAHLLLWWAHAFVVFGFIAYIPFSMLRHVVAAPLNIFFQPFDAPGALRPVSMEEVEATGRFGAGTLEDFTFQELVSLDACTHCGRCQDACPAYAADYPLSPKAVVLDLQGHMTSALVAGGTDGSSFHGEVIQAETLWSCVSCRACVEECPVVIDQLGLIMDMRRHLVGEGAVPATSRSTLMKLTNHGNVYGFPQDERADWAEGLEIKEPEERDEEAYLFFVGCVSSFDKRNQRIAKALTKVLKAAGVAFFILGPKERCCGDPARRYGDEFLYQQLVEENLKTFERYKVKRIVTHCPHCFNTLKNEYPQFGGDFEVLHHSHLIERLLGEGRLPLKRTVPQALTFHDSCYLGRHNGTFDAPREAFRSATGRPVLEMEKNRDRSFCCGGGGGHMWMELDVEAQRINQLRFNQALDVKAETIGTACPFCVTMLEDAGKVLDREDVKVRDFVEILSEALDEET
jgi:Fe-S oxidoreductase